MVEKEIISLKGGTKEMEETLEVVYKEICPRCGKEIKALTKRQVEYNFKSHLISCKGNEKQ